MKLLIPARRILVTATAAAAVAALLTPVGLAQYPVESGNLALSSTELTPGGTVNLSGGGFAPGGSVSIFFRSDPVLLETVSADSTGRIDADVAIPRDASPGTHTLEARGPDAGGGTLVLTTTIEVLATEASGLPNTGFPLLPLVGGGAAALLAGATLRVLGRRARNRA